MSIDHFTDCSDGLSNAICEEEPQERYGQLLVQVANTVTELSFMSLHLCLLEVSIYDLCTKV